VSATQGGGVVRAVDFGSPASRAGVVDGDVLVSVDGEALRDIIDWQWSTEGDAIEIAVRHGATTRTETLTRASGEPWGIEFADAVFDGTRTCRNRCAFCFMTQLPRGLRRALYLRDDDYRLSFLQGNFVTLTNLSDADVDRIAEQQLSPLYVSLHAVDPAVRATLVCAREDRALDRFDELLGEGIDMHVQIVLVPGVNDGPVLEQTLTWLAEREGVVSVGIVPLGFTAHQQTFSASYEGAAAAAVIEHVEPWQCAFMERDGVNWVYLADEFYLKAGRPVPETPAYDDFPQYENGIGIVRSFLDDLAEAGAELASAMRQLPLALRVDLVSGTLAAPVIASALAAARPEGDSANGVRVLPVPNTFFGGNVSVTGLLTASDLLPAISASDADVFLVPDIVANADGLLLDDVAAAQLGMRSGRDVRLVSCTAGGLVAALFELAEDPPITHKE
jgi:putative radical SAM enzyme (TIGR03279 family)